ncbi:uncharacterized protein LOC143589253 [Bidens hawaiensis]|uniref:uncharacterized protein LOC143589253 n=1 Tax=Bidens hawaiensis TaxID=980011 RepID=UPI00404A3D2C
MRTAKEMWEALKTRHLGSERVKETKLQTLTSEFDGLKMKETGTIDEYAATLSSYSSKAATLGEIFSEEKMVKKFLTSLSRRFIHIVASLEQVLDLKTVGFDDVVGRLKAYEERIKEDNLQTESIQSRLMFTKSEPISRGRGSYASRGRGRGRDDKKGKGMKRDLSHIKCYRCDEYGHFFSRCPDRFRKDEVNLNRTEENETNGLDASFFMMEGVRETVYLNEDKVILTKYDTNSGEADMWHLDNGASYHMTGNRDCFAELNEQIVERVRFGDGSCVPIKGKGSIVFKGKSGKHKWMTDIYYIPGLQCNVISLGQATESG